MAHVDAQHRDRALGDEPERAEHRAVPAEADEHADALCARPIQQRGRDIPGIAPRVQDDADGGRHSSPRRASTRSIPARTSS